MVCGKVLGKTIRNVRLRLHMTQPRFARWLSQETGEIISSMTVCRMENFGARDACHPIPPSPAVNKVICPRKEQ
jgi:hypothetical protein